MSSLAVRPAPIARSTAFWGVVLVIATEASLFATLIASYFYLRFKTAGAWPPDGIEAPKLLKPAVMTALLVASSGAVRFAELGVRADDLRRLRAGLAVTFLLGGGFLALQVIEYRDDLDRFRPQTDAYGSLFYTVTGVHAAHVIAGLLLLGWTQFFAWRGAYRREQHEAVQVAALFWYFIPGVWVAVFAALYLSPHL
jgi:cytochrome c oxidase subunit III